MMRFILLYLIKPIHNKQHNLYPKIQIHCNIFVINFVLLLFPDGIPASGYLTAGGYYAPAMAGLQGLTGTTGTAMTQYAAAAGPTVSQQATAGAADGRIQ